VVTEYWYKRGLEMASAKMILSIAEPGQQSSMGLGDDGCITHPAVAEGLSMPYVPPERALGKVTGGGQV
jgi:hypothetical protein